MNRRTALLMLAALGSGGFSLAATPEAKPPAKEVNRLVAHEWGTFTGVVDSGGNYLGNYTSVGGDLPPFVDTRQRDLQRREPKTANHLLFIKGYGVPAFQRMETPVIYFYADKATTVDVRVDLNQGMLTEFYPPVSGMAPAYGKGPGEPGAGAPATKPSQVYPTSTLEWKQVRIAPREAALKPPVITDGNHYAAARVTDSNFVQTTDCTGREHTEKFLFYRGLGNFSLPISLKANKAGSFQFANTGKQPIRTAILVDVGPTGEIRFASYRDLRTTVEMSFPESHSKSLPEALGEELVHALVGEGLYEKEARAMVATWRSQWLGETGTRVLYMVPREVTDKLMPLQIQPTPTETVRVLVGRVDVLTSEKEAAIDRMITAALKDESIAAGDSLTLEQLGRFRDAALTAAIARKGELSGEQRTVIYRAVAAAAEKNRVGK